MESSWYALWEASYDGLLLKPRKRDQGPSAFGLETQAFGDQKQASQTGMTNGQYVGCHDQVKARHGQAKRIQVDEYAWGGYKLLLQFRSV